MELNRLPLGSTKRILSLETLSLCWAWKTGFANFPLRILKISIKLDKFVWLITQLSHEESCCERIVVFSFSEIMSKHRAFVFFHWYKDFLELDEGTCILEKIKSDTPATIFFICFSRDVKDLPLTLEVIDWLHSSISMLINCFWVKQCWPFFPYVL